MYDFGNINLFFWERAKLFLMRFKKRVSSKFLGKQKHPLLKMNLVSENYLPYQSPIGEYLEDGTYSLTEKYYRYLVYKRHLFLKSMANSIVFPIIVSVITSIITVLLLQKLGLQ